MRGLALVFLIAFVLGVAVPATAGGHGGDPCAVPLNVYSGYQPVGPGFDLHRARCFPFGNAGVTEDTRIILPAADVMSLAYWSYPYDEVYDHITVRLSGLGFGGDLVELVSDGHPTAPIYQSQAFPLDRSARGCLEFEILELDERTAYHTFGDTCAAR